MKLIIAGTRTINKYRAFYEFQKWRANGHRFGIHTFLSGEATGPDQVPYLVKEIWGDISPLVEPYPADWDTHGKAAGPIRNRVMAKEGDALLLIWDGKSRGSNDMRKAMKELWKPVYEVLVN